MSNEKLEAGLTSHLTQELDTEDMVKISLEMSNFNNSIDEGLANALIQGEAKVFAQHSAWNYCGSVYFYKGMFYEEVWQFGHLLEVLVSDSLESLMIKVCDKYGYD